MKRKLLDIKTIKSTDNIDIFKDYMNDYHKNWIKYIVYPVSQIDLDRVCDLFKGKMYNSMGDLYLNETN